MEDLKEKEKAKNTNNLETEFKKYIKYIDKINYYDPNNLINKENVEDLLCPICSYIYNRPESCSYKANSHTFCKDCINNYLKDKNDCPICKLNFGHEIKKEIYNEMNKLQFQCTFKNEGCNEIISYNKYLNHVNNCKYIIERYECNIQKYNYNKKEFEKCGYIGNKKEMENHFKLCGFISYYCLFCKENILQKNLENHVINKCKFRIIKNQNGNKYIGEVHNNLKDGYGILYLPNGIRYEGEFKNDKVDGYGIINNLLF